MGWLVGAVGIEPGRPSSSQRSTSAIRDLSVATLLRANDLAVSRSNCRLPPPRKSRKCGDDNKIDNVGRGVQLHAPRYFDDLTVPVINSTATKEQTGSRTENNHERVVDPPEVAHTSQYKRVATNPQLTLTKQPALLAKRMKRVLSLKPFLEGGAIRPRLWIESPSLRDPGTAQIV
jgi:hypothetical protein